MSDLNSLQGWYTTSLLDQSKTVSYKVCGNCKPQYVWRCECACDKNAATIQRAKIMQKYKL